MSTIDEIKKTLSSEKERMKKIGISQIGIFGSYVKGSQNPDSDIDILIEITSDSALTFFSLLKLESELSEMLNTKVDLVLKNDLKPFIAKQILSEVEYV
jgi:predicted nucleotidyltransferase